MNISHETPEDTDRRLRRVLALATIDVDPCSWWFEELHGTEFPPHLRNDAIAAVRDMETWSQLVPIREGDEPEEAVRVWTFHFPDGIDNSGFVGWLASHIKNATGSGVFVVCGQNSNAGGIYDHWGCPDAVADEVFGTIAGLAVAKPTPPDSTPFDGLELRVVSTDIAGEVGDGTRLSFQQDGRIASARYAGGKVALGLLVGLVDGQSLAGRYVQLGKDGRLDAGHSTWELRRRSDGAVQVTERFTWDTRAGSGTNEFEQVAPT